MTMDDILSRADDSGPESLSKTPTACNVIRSRDYSYEAPSPPLIDVPLHQWQETKTGGLTLRPSAAQIRPWQMTADDYLLVTGNREQVPTDRACVWKYQHRHEAQPILDFLYLGPSNVVRDDKFLQREAITMVLVVRDARLAHIKLLSVEKATRGRNLAVRYLNLHHTSLLDGFREGFSVINEHILAVQRRGGHGRVLVCCDSGNGQSAAVVVAYIMALYDSDLIPALGFVAIQRFCCTFDEDTKRILQTWGDTRRAENAVARDARTAVDGTLPDTSHRMARFSRSDAVAKRGSDDMDCVDDDDGNENHRFAPFADVGDTTMTDGMSC
ncbi:hypothetical protein DCS_04439 [Drechmeria coniospora]|uniref:Tyrosine specific protein phosphatases domain-containing protein n=1 Tax=Drechmeria coniospora TaxID=98403 RepID=A0A151GJZ9_DRECN|nr:hypothetical protein DCS_04439 [Drechmeria coniospora]KYK57430.1 hypothetical protein DCS_04439 [Drechmeria coniospora]ODA79333.1 hypothetical protein RJ55_04926 [Drechmeria coniospora]